MSTKKETASRAKAQESSQAFDVELKFTGNEPTRAESGSAGLDLRADVDVIVENNFHTMVGTGTFIELPETHFALLIPRSSLSTKRDLVMINGVGVIDAGYRGEIKVPLISMEGARWIRSGERIAQIVILPVPKVRLTRVEALSDSERGDGGFGSTGM